MEYIENECRSWEIERKLIKNLKNIHDTLSEIEVRSKKIYKKFIKSFENQCKSKEIFERSTEKNVKTKDNL